MSATLQSEVVYRIATLGQVDPALLKEVENSLNESLQCTANDGLAVEGSEALAVIINAGASPLEKGVLERMDNQDPEIAESVRRRMLVFTDLARLPAVDMQVLLEHVGEDYVRLALRVPRPGEDETYV